jgi:mono/diheme cytochrome c family protein
MKVNAKAASVLACGTVTAVVMAGVASMIIARPADATVQFAKQTGKSCADCHTDPKGGGALTALGEKFKANGNKMPSGS